MLAGYMVLLMCKDANAMTFDFVDVHSTIAVNVMACLPGVQLHGFVDVRGCQYDDMLARYMILLMCKDANGDDI